MLSVAVITSTIGRSDLERAILSVRQQSYPCKHYVFVDGKQYHQQAKTILDKYPEVIVTYLPMNTGANGWTNSSINAIAPFLVKEDVICYLDDDNWYEPNHVESGVKLLQNEEYDYAYSLRNLYTLDGEFLSPDSIESIGFYRSILPNPIDLKMNIYGNIVNFSVNLHKESHIDTNCFFLHRNIALLVCNTWFSGKQNDTNVWKTLVNSGLQGICTKLFTVNYIFDVQKFFGGFCIYGTFLEQEKYEIHNAIIKYLNELNLSNYGGIYPWDQE
ncbi:glycosyltransferase [Ursidibacter maritimus]|uniref:Glycosyltransferase n=1 Tax=Ursidibacter maritimus TaxID=1331689 RepID=A0A949T3B9_9PAST|nr:glycosyltransferase [Ursidibacter maritimus]KAE9541982.1 glycosyltransferase [Ursidibacter maritimus]MBV6523217.1 glycosyltransferase [Ursidibacter maritimus]MBV6525341.1 glycosyltransferase [Ursidibacter maritimus]MBV6527431.1 glycosyltransferase [Ursidibacter maritimus]MBV6531420.1 glycosyltransferase [Ursidibacter maritimus]